MIGTVVSSDLVTSDVCASKSTLAYISDTTTDPTEIYYVAIAITIAAAAVNFNNKVINTLIFVYNMPEIMSDFITTHC